MMRSLMVMYMLFSVMICAADDVPEDVRRMQKPAARAQPEASDGGATPESLDGALTEFRRLAREKRPYAQKFDEEIQRLLKAAEDAFGADSAATQPAASDMPAVVEVERELLLVLTERLRAVAETLSIWTAGSDARVVLTVEQQEHASRLWREVADAFEPLRAAFVTGIHVQPDGGGR